MIEYYNRKCENTKYLKNIEITVQYFTSWQQKIIHFKMTKEQDPVWTEDWIRQFLQVHVKPQLKQVCVTKECQIDIC